MSYDYETLMKEEMSSMKFFEYAIAHYEAEYSDSNDTSELLSALEYDEFDESLSISCRNMEGPLINNSCVCAGDAETARNVFSCLNIPIQYVWGYNQLDSNERPHAWNIIKLDGVWYNMDLTWSRDDILAGKAPKYLLQSDKDFNTDEHPYQSETPNHISCNRTVSASTLMQYIYGTETKKKEFLESIESTITLSDIQRSYDILIRTDKERKQQPSIVLEEY